MRKQYDFSKAKRGPVVKVAKGKTRITIRLDDEVLDWFRTRVEQEGGGNYQSLINEALKSFIEREEQPLEDVVRKVVREELKRAGRKAA